MVGLRLGSGLGPASKALQVGGSSPLWWWMFFASVGVGVKGEGPVAIAVILEVRAMGGSSPLWWWMLPA